MFGVRRKVQNTVTVPDILQTDLQKLNLFRTTTDTKLHSLLISVGFVSAFLNQY